MATRLQFGVERWAFWEPGAPDALAEIPEVAPLLRRRASGHVRAALRVAYDCAHGLTQLPVVFCSRHGEVQRSVELMEQLQRGEGVSPTTFSVSVHNTDAALFSISLGDRSAMSSLAAGADTLCAGTLEAALRLTDGDERVLLVAHDDAVPARFAGDLAERSSTFALGLLLCREGGERMSLTLETGDAPASEVPQPPQVAHFFASGARDLTLGSAPRKWVWRREG